MKRHLIMWQSARFWLCLMVLFFLGRLYYLADYFNEVQLDSWSAEDLAEILLSSMRFDSFVSTFLTTLYLAGEFLASAFKLSEKFPKYVATAISFAVIWTIVGDHFFFIYFKDHFNSVFWEFWENINNAKLVMSGFSDIVPLSQVAGALAAFHLISYLASRWAFSIQAPPKFYQKLAFKGLTSSATGNQTSSSTKTKITVIAGWSLVFILFGRATFQMQPLTLQVQRQALSTVPFFNMLHTNPFIPLARGFSEFKDAQNDFIEVDSITLQKDLEIVAERFDSAKNMDIRGKFSTISYKIESTWPKYFTKKPKHIVLIFMESFSAWVTNHEDAGFRNQITPNFQAMKKEGLFYPNHFPPAGGTFKNLIAVTTSFPGQKGATIGMNYRMAGHKTFPDTLPRVLERLGYDPTFFYAGQLAWHRLYNFIPKMGYKNVFGENHFPELLHHKYGLYDQGIFTGLHQYLLESKKPTFNFVLTLSNHPPYYLPDTFQPTNFIIPEDLIQRLVTDQDQFRKKLNSFQYSDSALGEFFRNAKNSEYLEDLLVVITGDHSNGLGLSSPAERGLEEELIPLLFWAPKLMKEEWKGVKKTGYTNHLDLMPTLASIGTDETMTASTWGKNILVDESNVTHSFAYEISCDNGYCVKRNQLYQVGDNLRLKIATKENQHRYQEINRLKDAFHNSALHYFRNYQPN